jgi:hypothetical protein
LGGQHAAVVEHGGRHGVLGTYFGCPRLGALDIILEISSNSFRLQFLRR